VATRLVHPAGGESPRLAQQRVQLQAVAASPRQLAQRRVLDGGGPGVVQRLSLDHPAWMAVTVITSSTDGAGGVLFCSDGSDRRLVVKPGVPADEELAAAHAHKQVSGKGGWREWEVKALGTRMADQNDVIGLVAARGRIERTNGPLDARTQGLLGAVAVGTTMIQEAAANSTSMSGAMQDQAPDRHLQPGAERKVSKKDRVKDDSPLKALMSNGTNFARSLGRVAATDLLLGNFDRLVEAANLENLLLNTDRKLIQPIDNTGGSAVARLTTGGGGPVASAAWQAHRLVALFIARNYDGIAADVWATGPATAAVTTVSNELLDGFTGAVGNRQHNVDPAERQAVEAKLTAHLDHIRAAFADGLKRGRDELIAGGGLPANGGVSAPARQQYAARLAMI
jgi:hypothetical protein